MKLDLFSQKRNIYVSHPSRGAWIEILIDIRMCCYLQSHPSRGAWIEILLSVWPEREEKVAPLAGCVD